MTTVYHTPIGASPKKAAAAATFDTIFSALDTAIGLQGGGAAAPNAVLIAWTESETYELTAATLDADGVITTATAKWPDAATGTFTTVTKNATWLAIDAYTITHTLSGTTKTVTQAAVTRDATGNVTVKPALTVA